MHHADLLKRASELNRRLAEAGAMPFSKDRRHPNSWDKHSRVIGKILDAEIKKADPAENIADSDYLNHNWRYSQGSGWLYSIRIAGAGEPWDDERWVRNLLARVVRAVRRAGYVAEDLDVDAWDYDAQYDVNLHDFSCKVGLKYDDWAKHRV